MKKLLERSQKFIKWKKNLDKNGILLKKYEILSLITKSNNEVLFAMLRAEMITPEGDKLPEIVFLRGDFVAILVHLFATDTKKDYLLLVKQRRVATGGFFYEFPAGMLDENNDIYQVAQKELYEETNIKIPKAQLILLNKMPFYSSPGLLDEAAFYFAAKLELPELEIFKLPQKNLGNSNENEKIETIVVEFEEAPKLLGNVHGQLHFLLYKEYLKNG